MIHVIDIADIDEFNEEFIRRQLLNSLLTTALIHDTCNITIFFCVCRSDTIVFAHVASLNTSCPYDDESRCTQHSANVVAGRDHQPH